MYKKIHQRIKILLGAMLAISVCWATTAGALPNDGQVIAGASTLSRPDSATLHINQTTDKSIINWQGYGINANETVRYFQPGSTAISLNRVIGSDPSLIYGQLSANGRVWVINPNGLLIGQSAKINVGSFLGATLDINHDDFMNGNYKFINPSGSLSSITHQGDINAAGGGYVAFISPSITNAGNITANSGKTYLASGDEVTLNFAGNDLIGFTIDKATAEDALGIKNTGTLIANGGEVILSAKAAGDVLKTVVNNEGIIQAQTIENKKGIIKLLGGMETNTVHVGGMLDASAPKGGDGGFVETSAAKIKVADDAKVTTAAPGGTTGTWLIDPYDFTVAAIGGDVTGAVLTAALVFNDVTIQTLLDSTSCTGASCGTGTEAGNGDIFVNDSITWSVHSLTLNAYRNIEINSELFGSGGAKLALFYGQGAIAAGNTATYTVNAPVNLSEGLNFSTTLGSDGGAKNYYVITSLGVANDATQTTLQGMKNNLTGYYALGSNIDAEITEEWNGGEGFTPVGSFLWNAGFTGRFDGLGHTITNLTINRPLEDYVGLFGSIGWDLEIISFEPFEFIEHSGAVSNVGLVESSVSGSYYVGGLAGANQGTVSNAYASVDVRGFGSYIGGLVGYNGWMGERQTTVNINVFDGSPLPLRVNDGTIINSYATGNVIGVPIGRGNFLINDIDIGDFFDSYRGVGGLVGGNSGTIHNTYATGNVSGLFGVGGLVGLNVGQNVGDPQNNDFVVFSVDPVPVAGGTITNSYATGAVTGTEAVGGLVGGNGYYYYDPYWYEYYYISGGTISNTYATGSVNGDCYVGGLVGLNVGQSVDGPIDDPGILVQLDDVINVGGTIINSYATGAVTGDDTVGGLVGGNGYFDSVTSTFIGGGTISNTYAAGPVIGNSNVGGLVGGNGGTVNYSFWDQTVNPPPFVDNGIGTPKSTIEMKQLATFTVIPPVPPDVSASWDIDDAGSTGKIWRIYEGNTYPLLRSFLTPLTVTANPYSKTYDGQAYSSDAGVTYSGFANGETPSPSMLLGTLVYNVDPPEGINAGLYDITPGGYYSHQQGYDIGYVDNTLTINPAALTVTANDFSKTYNGLAYFGGNGVVYSGFVNGETSSVLGGSLSYGGTSQGAKNVGNYTIIPGGLTANDGNYTISYVNGALTINPAALTVTARDFRKTYDGLAYSGGNGVIYSGFVNGETSSVLGGSLSYGGTSQGAINAGNYTIIPGGLTANDGNYTIRFINGMLTVTPAILTYSANEADRLYGAANPALTGSVTGFVNGELLADVTTGAATFTTNAISTSNVGSYSIIGSGLIANHGNYVFMQAAGNATAFTINPAPLSVIANDFSKTYNGLYYLGGNGVSYSGFVNGETSSVLTGTLAYSGDSQGATNAGSYDIIPSGLTAKHGNYTISFIEGTLTINPALLNVTANDFRKTYNGLAYSGGNGVIYRGFVNGETSSSVLSGTLAYGGNSQGAINAGGYTITPGGLTANHGNYTISFMDGTLTINPALLNVTANDFSKTYNGLAYLGGNGVFYSGFVNGETSTSVLSGTVAYGGNSQGAINTGGYTITPGGLTANHGNYTIRYRNGTLMVNPATLTITANDFSKTYNGLAFRGGNGVLYSGFVNGETSSVLSGSLAYGGNSQGAINTGSYAITPGGLSSGNYTISFMDGTLTVNPALLNVTANDFSKTYNGLAYSGGNGVSYSGFVNGETSSVLGGALAYGGNSQGALNTGDYTIIPSGLTAYHGNYTISFIDGTLTVNPAALSVTANADSKTYDGLAYRGGNGVLYSGFVNGETSSVLGGSLAYGGNSQGAINTGSYTIVPRGLTANHGNYAISYHHGVLAVNPAALSITANVDGKVYDGLPYNGGNGVRYSGLINGETSSVLTGTLVYGGNSQGAITPGGYTITPGGLTANYDNYAISYHNGALIIFTNILDMYQIMYTLNITDINNFYRLFAGVPPYDELFKAKNLNWNIE
ncbi:MAG: filamentous hemagglutinin N-terminal domain-containing protein [Deltaproteobacteria bacterium]|nr:filamentous hemagglutinin N-terminal domain-containing protein [Deltaproteobacteria bacterium]